MSGTSKSGSISCCEPRPVQRGHAPWGELKEKIRGCSSGSETPWSGHANFSLKRSVAILVDEVDRDEPFRQLSCGLDGLRKPRAQVGLHRQTIDDHLDRVLELLVERDLFLEQAQLAVDLDAREALVAQLLEDILVLALAVTDDRGVDGELRPFRQLEDLVDDRLLALARDRLAADRAVRPADPGIEKTQIVVDLGDRADRRARVPRGRLLVDRDRRREPFDRVDVGLLHHLEELARVSREALHVAPLALRIDGVEGQRGLAGARKPGDADQLVPGQPDVDVLEIVLPGTVDDELFLRHNRPSLARRIGSNKCSFSSRQTRLGSRERRQALRRSTRPYTRRGSSTYSISRSPATIVP